MRWIRTRNWPRPRFRTASLLLIVALIALGLGALKAYLSPARTWRRAIHQQDPYIRGGAWSQARSGRIAGLGPKETLEEVAAALEDADNEAARVAVTTYTLLEPDAALAASRLALRLLDSDPSVRQVAAFSIRQVVRPDGSGRELAVPALIAALDDPEAGVRFAAACSLGDIGYRVGHSPSMLPEGALRRRLGDSEIPVSLAAALALARCGGGEEAVPLLAGYLEGHRDEGCPLVHCSIAFEALMVLAVRSDRAASVLIEGVYREGRGESSETLAALAAVAVDDHRARERMIARAKADLINPSAEYRLSASLTLARIGQGQDAVPGLVEALDQGTPRAKVCAVATLRRLAMEDPDSIRAVLDNSTVAQGTRDALRMLLPSRSIP
jgi:hypothetical protein